MIPPSSSVQHIPKRFVLEFTLIARDFLGGKKNFHAPNYKFHSFNLEQHC